MQHEKKEVDVTLNKERVLAFIKSLDSNLTKQALTAKTKEEFSIDQISEYDEQRFVVLQMKWDIRHLTPCHELIDSIPSFTIGG